MIRRLLNIFRNNPTKGGARIIPRDRHNISRKLISRSALKVMKRLEEANHEAYLVGGGVRDLLLGGRPKDFDVATSATPEQVKHLFRGARIIGRRFRIVHVRFGREIIEVTTFRGQHDDNSNRKHAARSDQGMLLRDNVYGDVRSDALRRDFTVNALYYTASDFSVHDYTRGMEDIVHRKVRMIGEPKARYQEDPVRMLRAVRFAAKLDFDIEPATAKPIRPMADLLRNIPAARLFDETLKLFMAGYAARTLELLHEYDLLGHLIPAAAAALDSDDQIGKQLIIQAMHNTDHRIHSNKRVTPAFIFAALLWPVMTREQARLQAKGEHPIKAHQTAAQNIISAQLSHTAIPKRFLQTTREIWDLQGRLPRRQGKKAERVFEHPRFRAAYDFVLLREQAGENLGGLGDWWTRYQEVSFEEREAMVNQLQEPRGKKPRRRRRRKPTSTKTSHQTDAE
ncbi:polynucleotide adenylyltransferase PcnB [Maricurvus nonylphenolicus]|uniref:polynucleotide adenylyltransferase PcnB n=1 Tax=Maricurvus nonylphenolicus TaxID=1008307 RepID=UPI0036F2F244